MCQAIAETPARGSCTIVVPCYNEAVRLQIDRFTEFLSKDSGVRFLFVNDGSSDHTLTVLQRLAKSNPDRIAVLNQETNLGKAESVRTGMLFAARESSIIGFWDADLATPLEALPELLSHLLNDPVLEMVFGSRVRLLGRQVNRHPVRHYLGRVFASMVSILLRLPIYDTQCGAKLFRVSDDLLQVLAQPFETRWIFDVEIIARFMTLHRTERDYGKVSIYECPLRQWNDIAGSKVQHTDFLISIWDLMTIGIKFYHQDAFAKGHISKSNKE